jgi:serine/threonine protein kinase
VSDPYLGKEVAGQFRIVEKIGKGGMGSVYKAEQPDMNRYVAIKILHSRYLSRSDLVSRFRREARAMSQLSHPNTARVFLYGQLDDGACYFVMEHLVGQNLSQIVRAKGRMDPKRAIRIMVQVCGALEEAHQAGIVHRDLKPENIFVTTQQGMVFGTPEFMSPEQAHGKTLDARSDIYSLGVILYELLTGKLPFDAKQPIEYIQLHVNAPPIPLSERCPDATFPEGLEEVVMASLAKKPEERYATAAAFATALESVLQVEAGDGGSITLPTPVPAAPAPDPAPPIRRTDTAARPKTPWIMLGVGVVLAVAGVIALLAAFGAGS